MATTKDGRGWSLVFDDKTRPVEGGEFEELDQQTTIDQRAIVGAGSDGADDPLLKNAGVTLPVDFDATRSSEMTIRVADDRAPTTSEGGGLSINADETTAFKQADLLAMVRGSMAITEPPVAEPKPGPPKAPPPPVQLARLPDRHPTLEDEEEMKLFDDDPAPPLLDPGLLVEQRARGASRVRPIEPNDVRVSAAPVKPVDFTSFDIPPALELVLVPAGPGTVVKTHDAPSPDPPPASSPVPTPAVVLSSTVEPARPQLPAATPLARLYPPVAAPAPAPAPALFLPPPATPTPADVPEARLADVLREAQQEKKAKRKAAASPREGINVDDLQRMSATTDTLARSIPLILVAFMVVAAILVSLKLLRRDESPNQTHIELRFLPIGHHDGPIVVPAQKMQRVAIDTIPPGLLVLYNKEVLGRTPFSVDLPVTLVEPLAAEVSSPYYEAWVGELRLSPDGEYRIVATLKAR